MARRELEGREASDVRKRLAIAYDGLLEKAKQVDFDEESAKRMLSGKFTLVDVYQQIEQMQGMGSMDKLMEMLPFGAKIPKDLVAMQEGKIKKFKFAMDSMYIISAASKRAGMVW